MGTTHTTKASVTKVLILGLVPLSLLSLAWCFSPDFVEAHLATDGHISDSTRAVVQVYRIGLCVMASLFCVMWMTRKWWLGPLLQDFSKTAVRRHQLQQKDLNSAQNLMGCLHPGFLRIVLWITIPVWFIIVLTTFLFRIQWPAFILSEVGIQENGQALLYLLAGVCAMTRVFHRRYKGLPIGMHRWWMLGLGLFCILLALEETNWGQVYFNYRTPELFRQANYQHDVSIHNIWLPPGLPLARSYWANDIARLIAMLGVVIPSLLWVSKAIRGFVWIWEIPVPPLLAQGYFAAAALFPPDPGWMFGDLMQPTEMRETSLAMAFLIWILTERTRHRIYFR